tara:strand:+ start:810 stop:1172 length:363 start_codon:yes stop_codon:yes gene_type:complete
MREVDLQKILAIDFATNGYGRLWVFDSGMAYHKVGNEYIPFKYGPGVGFPDLAGFTMIEVTEEMKGKKLPIFTGLEIKLPKGYPSIQQRNFAAMLRDFNGIASEKITSFEGIENLIEQYK